MSRIIAVAVLAALPITAGATDPSEVDQGYDAEAAAAIAAIEAREAENSERDVDSYGEQVRRLPVGSVTGSRLRPTEGLARQVRNADADILDPGSAIGAQPKVVQTDESVE